MKGRPARVLIIDDSAVVRAALSSILDEDPALEVVGVAADPYIARNKIKKLKPDVVTLDVEMPRMDGLSFLQRLMVYRRIPVVMVSSTTTKGAKTTLKALALGAVDFVAKPDASGGGRGIESIADEIRTKVRIAAGANVETSHMPQRIRRSTSPTTIMPLDARINIDEYMPPRTAQTGQTEPVICVGSSTGGTYAVEWLLAHIPTNSPGIVVVQHMPAGFTTAFAARLNTIYPLDVVEAESGMEVRRGRVIIARGERHLLLQRRGAKLAVEVRDGPRVNRHKPSVDVLFRSAANTAGANALGIILTGMGDDGARGLLDMHGAGSLTIAQDEASCVVFGMPKAAIELGAARAVLPLTRIPSALAAASDQMKGARR